MTATKTNLTDSGSKAKETSFDRFNENIEISISEVDFIYSAYRTFRDKTLLNGYLSDLKMKTI